ncbi:MAG: S41 family peptidase [Paludibacteraceae bacterium]|nr:S41 family peptidase [Paludibacteraceae bacterium]
MKKFLMMVALVLSFGFSAVADSNEELQKLTHAVYFTSHYYVDSVKMSKLVDDAIVGMLEQLDPHSSYIPKEEVQKMNEPLEGSFDGIGVQFQMVEDTLLVVQTISGGPSEKVGIVAGDRIVYVNDTTIAGVKMQNTDIMHKLRGPKGTTVNVKVLRRGVKNLIDFRIVRDKIPVYSLDASYMVDDKIGYIKVNRFSATTIDEFNEALSKLKKEGMESLILDLQGNGGGYLTAAVALADHFLQSGRLITYTEGNAQSRLTYEATSKGDFEKGDLVVLIDENSASASEIVSGALQDWDRAMLVGRRSFGKGLVQKPIELPGGAQIRLTIARYYTPTGRCIQRPYKEGTKQYRRDLIERYNHGELMHEDSIVFPDSLKYKTLSMRRVVYGGGAIMPDVFIPLDTTRYTDYHRNLVAKGAMNKAVLNYVEANRKDIMRNYPRFEKYNKTFEVTDAMLKELTDLGEKEEVKFNEEEFAKSKELLRLQMKALIARDIWKTNEYFQIMNANNDSYLKAIELLRDKNLYQKSFVKRKE